VTVTLALLFWSLTLFETKHFIFDFLLQTRYQKEKKGIYGHPAGLLHAGLHAIGSLPAILLLNFSPELIAAIVAAEFVVHYHVDWLKLAILRRRGLRYEDARYWAIVGADQFLHQMTYVVILAVLARQAGL
jgi:hypothetical protein